VNGSLRCDFERSLRYPGSDGDADDHQEKRRLLPPTTRNSASTPENAVSAPGKYVLTVKRSADWKVTVP
jgi:hypothetical protein